MKGCYLQMEDSRRELPVFRTMLCLTLYDSCHFTSSDLFCANKYSVLFVVRDYKSVFSIIDKRERSEALSRNLLAIRVKSPINQLYTNGERVVFNTVGLPYNAHAIIYLLTAFPDV